MKKLFIAAVFAVSILSTAFAANTKKVTNKVMNSFSKEFGNVENVSWTARPEFTKASFTSEGRNVDAFFDTDGNLLGTSRNVNFENVPAASKKAFAKRFPSYSVKEVVEFTESESISYYVSAENNENKVVFKLNGRTVSVFKKEAKN